MHPVFIDLGFFTIYTYGVMIAIGLMVAIQLGERLAAKEGVDPNHYNRMIQIIVLGGIAGARLLFVLTRYEDYLSRPLSILNLREGGLVSSRILWWPYSCNSSCCMVHAQTQATCLENARYHGTWTCHCSCYRKIGLFGLWMLLWQNNGIALGYPVKF